MNGLDQGHLHPLHRASETEAFQLGIKPGTSCTAGEHSMQRAIRSVLLTAIRNLSLYYYSSPPSRDVTSSWLGIVAEFDSDADLFDWTRKGLNSTRGSKALEPLLRARSRALKSQNRVRIASCRGHHRVGAWPGPPTSSAYSIRDRCVSVGNRTRDLLHCRRTLYAKSHSNGVIDYYSEPRLVLLQEHVLAKTTFYLGFSY